jgi:hypothetical protein
MGTRKYKFSYLLIAIFPLVFKHKGDKKYSEIKKWGLKNKKSVN